MTLVWIMACTKMASMTHNANNVKTAAFGLNKLDNIFEDINRRCRTCLGICDEFNDLSKSVKVGESSMLLNDLISSCASVQILERDGLPYRICETCKETAVKSHLFRLQCETAEKYLQALSQNIIFKSTPVIPEVNNAPEAKIEDSSRLSRADTVRNPSYNSAVQLVETQENESAEHFCYSCNETFSSKKYLVEHLTVRKYRCPICDLPFHDANELTTHRNQHGAEPDRDNIARRTCPYCHKTFQYRTSMLKHQRKHDAPPKSCLFCQFKPASPNVLSKHMEQAHAHLKTFTCSLCNKTFFKKANLRLHIQIHSGAKKHTCEICGVSFKLRGNLSVHRRLHTGERPYTCSVCGRGFTQQSALRSHEAGHSDRKDHVCPECGAAFSRAGALRNHRKRHSATKPFECSICGRKFTFSSERKRHMSIHSGDKNYECEVCGKRFTRNANLKVHKRIHSGETLYRCGVCGKGFVQAHCLRTHMNTHDVSLIS